MSWAANNPEAYDEICVNGIVDKLETEIDNEEITATATPIIDHIREACPKAFEELVKWAASEIAEQESAYHTKGI